MTKFFSKTTVGFYPADARSDYEVAGSWPVDAVEITDAEHAALLAGQSAGQRIVADATGKPILEAAVLPTLDELRVKVLNEARQLRVKLFSVVDGLQASANSVAITSGVTTDTAAIESFKIGARNITKVDLSAATTEQAMRDVVNAQYKLIVGPAPASVKLAFAQALQ